MGKSKLRIQNAVMVVCSVVALFLMVALLTTFNNSPRTQAASTACPNTYVISSPTGGTVSSAPLSGMVQVALSAPPLTTTTIEKVLFYIDSQNVLGKATQGSTSGSYYWMMPWQTAVTANGAHLLSAEVRHADGMSCTVTLPTAVMVNNATAAPFTASTVNGWSGATNTGMDFSIFVNTNNTSDLRPYMVYEWTTTIGSVAPLPVGAIGHFFSGPAAGVGTVGVTVKYGGRTAVANIPVTVVSPSSTTTTNSTTTGITTSTTGQTSTSSTAPTTQTQTTTDAKSMAAPTLTSQLLLADTTIKQCLIKTIGEERVLAIESEKSRPTAAEFNLYRACFAKQSFVVASTLAPVEPTVVKQLKQTEKVEISTAKNTTEKVDDTQRDKLVFKGKAAPNSTVLLYVFSEPLVLATTTDANGEWSYTLEDPMAPGDHEAYALVDKGDGSYERSSPFSFLIGKAEASASNPQGYSLNLQISPTATANNRSANIFIAGIVMAVIVTGLLLGVYIVWRKKSRQQHSVATLGADTTIPTLPNEDK